MACSAGSQLAHAQGTVMSEVKVSSALDGVLDMKGSLFMTSGCDRSFLTVLSCQLFDTVYISVSWLMSGASNSMPVQFEDCGKLWHVTMVTKSEVLFLNLCLRILQRQVPSERDLSQQRASLS